MNINITSIKRFAVHDGDGIRTTVFFKGCPMKCLWCHNPETLSPKRQTAFYRHKCTDCGKCAAACNCHTLCGGKHIFDRTACTSCGKCAAVCPNDALEIFGKEVTADALFDILVKDKNFYDESGGGVTLSGGECLMQADECAELLKRLRQLGINTAVDTCGFVPRRAIDKVIPYTDIFLYDIKAIDEDVHIRCTGRSNKIILENIEYINSRNIPSEIRVPYVPGFNDKQLDKIKEFVSRLSCVTALKVLPYHNYAASKYIALGMENTLPEMPPHSSF